MLRGRFVRPCARTISSLELVCWSEVIAAGTDSEDKVDTGRQGDAIWRRLRSAPQEAFGKGAP